LASAFIDHDNLIEDKQGAINEVKQNIEKLINPEFDTAPLFRLMATEIILKLQSIFDDLEKKKLLIVLDDMCLYNEEDKKIRGVLVDIKKAITQ